jgi:ribonuclease VapC
MSEPKAVLDASALLAWVFEEKGSATVQQLAGHCVITAANMTEVLYRAAAEKYRKPLTDLLDDLTRAGFAVVENTAEDAAEAARLIAESRKKGGHLSLGDGLCIAAGIRSGLPVVGGDQEWEALTLPIKVIPFR